MRHRIDLKDARLLVTGGYRDVYQHPLDDDLLVKVVKPGMAEVHARRAAWYNVWRKHGHYKSLVREINEYLALQRRGQHRLPFIQHYVGVVDTEFGLGMVVKKVRGRDGGLAPTVTALVGQVGLTAELRSKLGELLAEVVSNHIVFGDISGNNIVHAGDAEHGDRLVIVDGLSDRLWIPLNSMSRRAYRVYAERRFARALGELEAIGAQSAAR